MRKLLEITTGRHPFQVATVLACPLASIAIIATGKHPASLDAALPPPLADLWLIALALSGIITTIGGYWPAELDTGLLIEGAGVSVLAAMLTIYATALFVVNGADALGPGSFILSLAVAGAWRAVQIAADVRKVWRAQRQGMTVDVRTLIDPGNPAGPGAR